MPCSIATLTQPEGLTSVVGPGPGPPKDAYAANFGPAHLYGDITMVDGDVVPAHDLLTAGFPCQPFTRASGIRDDPDGLHHLPIFGVIEMTRISRNGNFKGNVVEIMIKPSKFIGCFLMSNENKDM